MMMRVSKSVELTSKRELNPIIRKVLLFLIVTRPRSWNVFVFTQTMNLIAPSKSNQKQYTNKYSENESMILAE